MKTLRAEWTKLRTLPSTGWLLLGLAAASVAVSLLVGSSMGTDGCARVPGGCDEDLTRLLLVGAIGSQVLVVVLGVLVISAEYGTGTIGPTLAANPRRAMVLAAKAVLLSGLVVAVALPTVFGSVAVGRPLLARNGFTVATGLPALTSGPVLRAILGTVLYYALIGLLSLGVGAVARHTAGALGTVLAVLYVPPTAIPFIANQQVRELVQKYSPLTAGLNIQVTRHLERLLIGPWPGLGVLAGYAAAALLAGLAAICLRDA